MLNKIQIFMFGILLLILGSTAQAELPPRISWTPAQLTPASMAPGTSKSYTVVLKHTGILPILFTNQLRIVTEGEVTPFITISQPKFPPIFKRGNQVTFQVTISIPANTPAGIKKGNLVLKRALSNNQVIKVWRADALPVTISVEQGVVLNKPPVANAGINQTVPIGNNVTLNGFASSDPDGNSLTYDWSFKQVPPGSTVVLSSVTAVNPSFTPDKSGIYVVQLVVNDGTINSSPSEIQITVMTSKQVIQSLEDQGILPNLDRSTDVNGPDSDSNGIRDDVSSYIETLPITPDQKPSVNQLAKAVQRTLLVDITVSTDLRQASTNLSSAIQCISIKFPDVDQRSSIVDGIEKVTVNTRERSMQYIQFNNALSGTVTKLLSENTCEN